MPDKVVEEESTALNVMRWIWALPSSLIAGITTYYVIGFTQSHFGLGYVYGQFMAYMVSGWAFTVIAVTCVPRSKRHVAILCTVFLTCFLTGFLWFEVYINTDFIYNDWISVFTVLGSILHVVAYFKGESSW